MVPAGPMSCRPLKGPVFGGCWPWAWLGGAWAEPVTSIGAGPSPGRWGASGAPVAPSMPAIVEPCVRRANPHGCGAAGSGGVLSSTETCPTPRPAPSRFLARRPFVHLRKLMVSTAALSASRSGPGPRRPAGLRPRCDGRRDCAGCCGGWPRHSWRPHRWRCTARCGHLARGREFAIQDGCLARLQLRYLRIRLNQALTSSSSPLISSNSGGTKFVSRLLSCRRAQREMRP